MEKSPEAAGKSHDYTNLRWPQVVVMMVIEPIITVISHGGLLVGCYVTMSDFTNFLMVAVQQMPQ